MQETCVHFLGQEDPLEKEMATHSSILAWEIPWTEEPGGLQSMVIIIIFTAVRCTSYFKHTHIIYYSQQLYQIDDIMSQIRTTR